MRGIIAAGHPLTASAGEYILRDGGNAIDAVIAAAAASWVVEPVLASPGGGAFALVHSSAAPPVLLDGFAQTPRRQVSPPHRYLVDADFGPSKQGFYLGPGTVATPGKIALLAEMHRRGGALPWRALFTPAIEFARNGFTITRHAAQLFTVVRDLYLANEGCRALFGRAADPSAPLRENDPFQNPKLADFLEMLAVEGHRFFYEGEIGQSIAILMATEGGHLERTDFERYAVHAREPLAYTFRGARILSNPPPSLGARYVQLGLRAIELELQPLPAREDRHHPVHLARLQSRLEQARQDPRVEACSGNELPPIEDPCWDAWRPRGRVPTSLHGTTHISAIDAVGNAVALTASNGSGSAVAVPEAGFLLNNMLGETDLLTHPEDPLAWTPDTRMASMMAPTIVERPAGDLLATGSGGSKRIRTTLLQILLNTLHHGLSAPDAVQAPRLHLEENTLHFEDGLSGEQLEALARLEEQPALVEHSRENLFFGGAHTVHRTAGGQLDGVGDPRRGGCVAIVR